MRDGAYVIKFADIIRGEVWGNAHAKWAEAERVLDGTYTLEVPSWAKGSKIVTPTGWKMIHFAAAQMISAIPVIMRRPMDDSEADRKLANKVATFAALTMANIGKHRSLNPWRAFFAYLNLYGYAAFYGPVPDYRLWNDRYEQFTDKNLLPEEVAWRRKSKSIMPFVVECPNPMSILMDPDEGKEPSFGMWESERPRFALERDFNIGERFQMSRVPDFTPLQTITYVDDNEVSMWLRETPDRPIYQAENVMGYIPFTQAFSGLGLRRYNYGTSGVEYMAESLLQASMDTLIAESEAMTHFMALLRSAAWRQLFVRANSGINEQTLGRSLVVPVNGEDIGKQIEWSPLAEIQPWMIQMLQLLKGYAEGSTLSPAISGGAVQGTRTASQHGQIAASARLIYNPPMEQTNDACGIVMGNCGRMLGRLSDLWDGSEAMSITVEGMMEGELRHETIVPADFQDDYMFHVNFEASDPMVQLAKRELAMEVRQARIGPAGSFGISYETFMKLMDIAGVDAETEMRILNDEKIIERAEADPAWWEMKKQAAAQEMGVQLPMQMETATNGAQ